MSDYHIHTKPKGIQRVGRAAITRLLPIASKLRYLVVTGQSGIVPGSIAAFALGLDLVIIRKDGETSHGNPVEATDHFWQRHRDPYTRHKLARRCCVLDDFTFYGTTLGRVERALSFRPHFVAFYSNLEQDSRPFCQTTGLTRLSFNLYRWEQEAPHDPSPSV